MSVRFTRSPAGWQLETVQRFGVARPDLFPFFADAVNLAEITPPSLKFRILTPLPVDMRVGALIDYRISIRGVPVRWRTEITVWEPPRRFVDEQIRGPYRTWRHEHVFVATGDSETEMTDRVTFAAPGGGLVRRWLIEPELRRIFEFRRKTLAERFGEVD